MTDVSDILSIAEPNDALMELSAWLRCERQRQRFTQSMLARRSGVPASTISRLEQTGLASTDALFKIVFALNCLDAMQDFLKERHRLSAFPMNLSDRRPERPVLRVRAKAGEAQS